MSRGQKPGKCEKRSGRVRLVLAGLAALVTLQLAYLGLAALFLGTDLASSLINRDPERLEVRWDKARSWLPGLVHLEQVRIRGGNPEMEWEAALDRATVAVSPLSLARRRFRAPWIGGEGLRFRLRPLGEGAAPAVARRVTLPASGARAGQPSAPDPWRITLDSVTIERVEEIRIGEERLTGSGRLAASIELETGGELAIDRVVLDFPAAALDRGERQLARNVRLRLETSALPFVPHRVAGKEVLRSFSGELSLAAELTSVAVFDRLLTKAPWLSLAGAGTLAAELGVEAGRLEPGSNFRLQAAPVVASFLDYRAEGHGLLSLETLNGAKAQGMVLAARFEEFGLRRRTARDAHVRGRGLEVRVTGSSLDLLEGFEDLEVVVDLPSSEVDFRFYDRYLPRGSPLRLTRGDGVLGGRMEYRAAQGSGSGEIELRVDRAGAHFGDVALEGGLLVSTRLRDGDFQHRRFDIAGTHVEIRDAHVVEGETRSATEEGWWARIDLPRAAMELDEPLWLDASVAVRMKSSAPLMAVLADRRAGLEWIAGLMTVEDVRGRGRVVLGKETVRVEGLEARGGRHGDKVEILGDMTFDRRLESGLLFARYGRLAVAVEVREGRRDWRLLRPRRWFEKKRRQRE